MAGASNCLWTTASGLAAATLDGMTIASHFLALLRERGPLTADELGSACHEAGVTTSRNPTQAVINALRWNHDGRSFRVGDRYDAVTDLLEGRWLTFHESAGDPTTTTITAPRGTFLDRCSLSLGREGTTWVHREDRLYREPTALAAPALEHGATWVTTDRRFARFPDCACRHRSHNAAASSTTPAHLSLASRDQDSVSSRVPCLT